MGIRTAAVCTAALILSAEIAHADISISAKPTQNMSCSGGVCTATAKNATLNVDDLTGISPLATLP